MADGLETFDEAHWTVNSETFPLKEREVRLSRVKWKTPDIALPLLLITLHKYERMNSHIKCDCHETQTHVNPDQTPVYFTQKTEFISKSKHNIP